MKSSNPLGRQLHIHSKIVKGKKIFYIVCYEYFGSSSTAVKEIKYPEFRKNFTSKSAAVTYARETFPKIQKRANVRFRCFFE